MSSAAGQFHMLSKISSTVSTQRSNSQFEQRNFAMQPAQNDSRNQHLYLTQTNFTQELKKKRKNQDLATCILTGADDITYTVTDSNSQTRKKKQVAKNRNFKHGSIQPESKQMFKTTYGQPFISKTKQRPVKKSKNELTSETRRSSLDLNMMGANSSIISPNLRGEECVATFKFPNLNTSMNTTQQSIASRPDSKQKNKLSMLDVSQKHHDVVFNEMLDIGLVQRSISNTPAMMITRPNSGLQQHFGLKATISRRNFKNSPLQHTKQDTLQLQQLAKNASQATEFDEQFKYFKKLKERNMSVQISPRASNATFKNNVDEYTINNSSVMISNMIQQYRDQANFTQLTGRGNVLKQKLPIVSDSEAAKRLSHLRNMEPGQPSPIKPGGNRWFGQKMNETCYDASQFPSNKKPFNKYSRPSPLKQPSNYSPSKSITPNILSPKAATPSGTQTSSRNEAASLTLRVRKTPSFSDQRPIMEEQEHYRTQEDDSENFDQDKYLARIRASTTQLALVTEEGHSKGFYDFEKVPQQLANAIQECEDGLNDQEKECTDTLWKKEKMKKLKNRQLLKEMVEQMRDNPDFSNEFIERLLLPEKMKTDLIDNENNYIDKLRKANKPKQIKEIKQSSVKQQKYGSIIRGATFITKRFIAQSENKTDQIDSDQKKQTSANNQQKLKIRRSLAGTTGMPIQKVQAVYKLEDKQIESLMVTHDRSSFMLSDIKDVNKPRNLENTHDLSKEFAKHCFKNQTIPISAFIIQNLFRDDIYAVFNKLITKEQSLALGESLKYTDKNIREICFANNQFTDKQFAQLLTHIMKDKKLYNDLQKLTYTDNEFGVESMKVLQEMMLNKHIRYPFTHLSLVDIKRCVNIDPILKTLGSKDNQLQTLILPQLNISEEGHATLCNMIKGRSFLKVLDISWNSMLTSQIKLLFRALSQNKQLEYLNLAMTSINTSMNLLKLRQFIRENDRLIHLDLSGMFKTAQHVRSIIKAIKKSETLLALHLSNTPVIEDDIKLQSYIRKKMGITAIKKRPRNNPAVRKRLRHQIRQNWVLQDKMKNQVQQEDTITKLFKCQKVNDPTSEHQLVLQRTIDLWSSPGNLKWIGSDDCYVCQRWQATCFLYNPEAKFNEDSYYEKAKTRQSESYRLSGTFDSLMMRYGKEEWSSFEMQNLDVFLKNYQKSPSNLQYFVRDLFTFEPRTAPDKALTNICDANTQWKIYADFVKPSAKVELMQIYNADSFARQRVQQHIFVPSTKLNDVKVKKVPKTGSNEEVIRVLDRQTSVFADWQCDTEEILTDAANHDFQYWRVKNLCYDDNEYEEIVGLVHQYYDVIKHVYTHLIADTGYPYIQQIQFSNFIQKMGLIDDVFHISDVDRCFIATDFEEENLEDVPKRSLCRFEFIEGLVRVAEVKFLQSKIEDTLASAFELLLKSFVTKRFKPDGWQEFRDNELWQEETNDVIKLNQSSINKIYKDLTSKKGKQGKLVLKNMIDLVTKKVEVVLENDAIHCYGMSKMTIVNETSKKAAEQFNTAQLVEFYEYLGRIASFKYKELEDETLAMKIERTLDLIMPAFGMKRIVLDVEDVKHYSSTDSIDYNNDTNLRLRQKQDENPHLDKINGLQSISSESEDSFISECKDDFI